MKSFKRLLSQVPEGTAALFFIQIFATLGFAVLYSTLVLYAEIRSSGVNSTRLDSGSSSGSLGE